jgi:[ribosomal protein S5]-alanine N-acetyltransferase
VTEPLTVIRAPRLDLVLISPALIQALVTADWNQAGQLLGAQIPAEWRGRDDWQWLAQRPDRAETDPSATRWLPRMLLLRSGGNSGQHAVVVGEAGFHGPPDSDGRIEFGYMVVGEFRRRGYAEEAVRALLAWAAAEHQVTRFRATVSPRNTPSLSLIRKLGFVQVGAHHHERRGEELIFHRDDVTPAQVPVRGPSQPG